MNSSKKKGFECLLRLMTETEKLNFKADFILPENANDKEILEAIEKLPKYEAVRAFIRAGAPTLVLLREVFEILEIFGISTRTTGCVFVLANPSKPEERTELVFSQQAVGAVCSWSARKNWNRVSDALSDLESTWMDFQPLWQTLLQKAKPRREEGELDIVESYIQKQSIYEQDTYHVNKDAQKVLRHFADRIGHMEECLKEIPDGKRPEEITRILYDVRQLEGEVEECLSEQQEWYRYRESEIQEPPDQQIIEQYTSWNFSTDFDKFLEDVYNLADLIQGEDMVDMLQIDIWSARPQLFEVWVLLKLLSWLRGRGYTIDLLKTEKIGEQSPFRWNLSYSKDSEPCAIVRDAQKDAQQFLFYQLYRSSGDMPDISLLENSNPLSSPVWSVDPKHSEKGGYSLSDYQKTAIRYHVSFGASLSLKVEYFDTSTKGDANPVEFDPHAKLIHGCRPDGSGLPILLTELSEFHPIISQVLVCIDFSSSFSSKREKVLERLRQRLKLGFRTNVATECICFAGSTTIVDNFDKWLNVEHGAGISPEGIVEGTESAPLVNAISEMKERMFISEVLLVTDGEFDIPAESLTNRIQDELAITVTLVTS